MRALIDRLNFRGKARLLHSLSPKQGERTVERFGYKIELDLSDYIQRSVYLHTFEPRESALVQGYLKPGMTFVDVGANVGYFTLMSSSLVGVEGTVVAFEPSPYAFGRLSKTIQSNHLPQVRAIQSGVSDCSGELQLFMPKVSGNHTPSMVANDGGTPLTVPIVTLDEYLPECEIHHVDLLKIDVEGFEPNVIRGGRSHFSNGRIDAILCEFNKLWLEANNSSPVHLFEEIVGYGYRLAQGRPDFKANIQNLLFIR